MRNGSKILLLNSLLVIKSHIALMKCPCYWCRYFIKFNDDINKIHASVILLGESELGSEKYAFHSPVFRKKFAFLKLALATLYFFSCLSTSYTSLHSSLLCPFLFVSFVLFTPISFLPSSSLTFLIILFVSLILQCPNP